MPKKKLLRRFEPRFGVTQPMLDVEAQWLGRELDDCLLLSLNELREMLEKRQAMLVTHDANLSHLLSRINGRGRLAMQCLLARDFVHIGLLYETFLGARPLPEAIQPAPLMPAEEIQPPAVSTVLPFRTSLFDV